MAGDDADRGGSGLLPSNEWLAPSARLAAMRLVELGTTVIAAAAIALAEGYSNGAGRTGAIAAGACVAAGLLLVPVLLRRYRSWGYHERDADLVVKRGVLFRRLTVVPYGRMQLVDVTAGAVERLFGLQTIHLHTAAAATDARIPGLLSAEATRLRDRLAALGEAQAAGI